MSKIFRKISHGSIYKYSHPRPGEEEKAMRVGDRQRGKKTSQKPRCKKLLSGRVFCFYTFQKYRKRQPYYLSHAAGATPCVDPLYEVL